MKLVLVRHGQSVWNLENRFTGWTDVELSDNGIKEAKEAGKLLKENEFTFDVAYTSVLKRANETLNIILKELGEENIPIHYSWKLMDTLKRVIDYYETEIKKSLLSGQNVIIAAHGNSLRALIKYLEDISNDDIMNVEIPTGKPYVYELDDNLNIINKYYL